MGSKPENKNGAFENALKTNEVAKILNFDLEGSVENLLRSAARALKSEEASILVRDPEDGHLRFLKAIGEVGDQLEGVEIPAGKGIAGFVASSGQPMAISDVDSEASFYQEIDKKTGFSTEILLATPLIYDGEIIGVVEFINREGQPPYEPFSAEEMDRATIYGDALAALVNALISSRLTGELAGRICEDEDRSQEDIRLLIAEIAGKKEHSEMLELAVLVKAVSDLGGDHRKLCRKILESVLDFGTVKKGLDYSDV